MAQLTFKKNYTNELEYLTDIAKSTTYYKADYATDPLVGKSYTQWLASKKLNDEDLSFIDSADLSYLDTYDGFLYLQHKGGDLTKDDMYDWLNQCNIYNVRSNVKVTARHYNSVLGIETSHKEVSGSGFIFCESGNTKYVLTSYFLTSVSGYSKVSFKLNDAFQTEYNATLYKASEKYGLAILYFTDTKQNDLYVHLL